MKTRMDQLDAFRREVNLNLALGPVSDLDLVTNDDGECPVVVALDVESFSTVLGRVRAAGGAGTVFSRGSDGVRMVSVIPTECAIADPGDQMIPGGDASFGLFLDYVETVPDGVSITAAFAHPARAQDARPVELTSA